MRPILALTLFLCACGTSTQTRIEDKTFVIPVPTIEDSLQGYFTPYSRILRDTVYVAVKVVERDTVIDIRFVPETKKFYIKIKPDSVKFTVRDTVTVFLPEQNPEKHSFFWFVGFVVVIVAVGVSIFGAVKVMRSFGFV